MGFKSMSCVRQNIIVSGWEGIKELRAPPGRSPGELLRLLTISHFMIVTHPPGAVERCHTRDGQLVAFSGEISSVMPSHFQNSLMLDANA